MKNRKIFHLKDIKDIKDYKDNKDIKSNKKLINKIFLKFNSKNIISKEEQFSTLTIV
jgi:hypothetical protein